MAPVVEVVMCLIGSGALAVLLQISHKLGGIEVELQNLNGRITRLEQGRCNCEHGT